MLRYEFVVLLMMTSLLIVNGLRITMMCQAVNVEGLAAYSEVPSAIFVIKHNNNRAPGANSIPAA